MWLQREVTLSPRRPGFHLVTDEILAALPEVAQIRTGLLHLLLVHTSASLSLNENADPDVRLDLQDATDRLAPESVSCRHTCEGPDDMPAHVKAALIGCELTLPIADGGVRLGTWQGICLGEHRRRGGPRRVVATLQGELLKAE